MEIPLDKKFLESLLWKYADRVVEITKNIDKAKFSEIPYERIKLSTFVYDVTRIRYHYDFNDIENFTRYEWKSSIDIGELLSNSLYHLAEAIEVKKYILQVRPTANEPIIIPYTLSNFSRNITELVINNEDSNNSIQNLVSVLADDIELILTDNRQKQVWEIELEIANLHLENSYRTKDGSYALIQKVADDFIVERPVQHMSEREMIFSNETYITTKILFRTNAKKEKVTGFYPEKIKNQIQTELNILYLFKVGSIYPVSEQVIPISLIEHDTALNKDYPYESFSSEKVNFNDRGNFPYLMKESEYENFELFRNKLFNSIQEIDSENYLQGNYIDIAFHRYLDALLRSEVYAYRIISAISCLEALLSVHETEVTFKLKSRLSLLLGCVGLDPKTVSENISIAYDLRSKIVHGGELKEKSLEFARTSCYDILNYSRLTTLIFIQLKREFRKDKILRLLNNALIDKNDFALLNEKIKVLTIT